MVLDHIETGCATRYSARLAPFVSGRVRELVRGAGKENHARAREPKDRPRGVLDLGRHLGGVRVVGVLTTDNLTAVAGAARDYVISSFGWVFRLSSFGFLAFAVYLALSRYGGIRLGGEDERPESPPGSPTRREPLDSEMNVCY